MVSDDSILLDAFALVNGDRAETYGPPWEDYAGVADIVSGGLGEDWSPEQAIYQMLAVKMKRIGYGLTNGLDADALRDSLTDLCGYAECLWQTLNVEAVDDDDEEDDDDFMVEP